MPESDKSKTAFIDGLNGSQSNIAQYAPGYDLDKDTAGRLASGFGGGMRCMGDACGALTGACLVLGLEYSSRNDSAEKNNSSYSKIQQLTQAFEQQSCCLYAHA